jgi:lysyl-tRNA synthetase class 2
VEQQERFLAQKSMGADKDGVENHPMDIDFLKAMGCGMPPTGGVGVGIDRIVMLLTDSHTIREIIAFPLMRIRDSETPADENEPGGEAEDTES